MLLKTVLVLLGTGFNRLDGVSIDFWVVNHIALEHFLFHDIRFLVRLDVSLAVNVGSESGLLLESYLLLNGGGHFLLFEVVLLSKQALVSWTLVLLGSFGHMIGLDVRLERALFGLNLLLHGTQLHFSVQVVLGLGETLVDLWNGVCRLQVSFWRHAHFGFHGSLEFLLVLLVLRSVV